MKRLPITAPQFDDAELAAVRVAWSRNGSRRAR